VRFRQLLFSESTVLSRHVASKNITKKKRDRLNFRLKNLYLMNVIHETDYKKVDSNVTDSPAMKTYTNKLI
jgi:hypothetical protein